MYTLVNYIWFSILLLQFIETRLTNCTEYLQIGFYQGKCFQVTRDYANGSDSTDALKYAKAYLMGQNLVKQKWLRFGQVTIIKSD